MREAYAIIEAFEAARAAGKDRARRGDLLIEVPSFALPDWAVVHSCSAVFSGDFFIRPSLSQPKMLSSANTFESSDIQRR